MNNIHIPPVVKNLLIINVLFFAATYVFQGAGVNLSQYLGVFYFDSPFFKVWQPVTYMFMHANLGHIFSNMFGLFMFGGVLETRWGAKRFLNFYLICGLGALALQMGVQAYEIYQITGHVVNIENIPGLGAHLSQAQMQTLSGIYGGPMVGASGAIFGILVAFGMLYPNTELMMIFFPIPIKAKYFIPLYIVFELYSGVAQTPGDSVAHYAHLGGALVGFILVKLWKDKDNNRFYTYYE
ncbi:MAG: rhomboid family intramembrane serine protease [Bacteroidota bacterium]